MPQQVRHTPCPSRIGSSSHCFCGGFICCFCCLPREESQIEQPSSSRETITIGSTAWYTALRRFNDALVNLSDNVSNTPTKTPIFIEEDDGSDEMKD